MKFHKTKPSKRENFTKAARWCTPFGGISCAWMEHFIDRSYAGSKHLYHSCWPGKEDCYISWHGTVSPAKKLQMARNDLNHLILRSGHDELHIVMDMLRTIGAYIDSSGIDMCWIESELYGPSTVKQILHGRNMWKSTHDHIFYRHGLHCT